LRIIVFGDLTLYYRVFRPRRFEGKYCLYLPGIRLAVSQRH